MTAAEERVLEAVGFTARHGGWSYATRANLARVAGVSTRTVQRAVANLQDAHLLEVRFDEFTGDRMLRVREPGDAPDA